MNNVQKKILYVSYDGMTDQLGQSQVIPYMVELAKRGFLIDILSTEKNRNYYERKDKINETLRGAGITWHTIKYLKNPPVISTLIDIIKLNRSAKRLMRKNNYGLVHCRSYIAAFVGLRLKRKFNIKFIFDMRGFYPDERVDGNIWKMNNPVYKLIYNYFKKKELFFFKTADYTISLTYAGKKHIHTMPGLNNIPIEVIPCCADMQLFNFEAITRAETNQYRGKINISAKDFILTYLGSIGTWYMCDEMMFFFKFLKAKNKNAKFLFITYDDKEIIHKIADKHSVSRKDLIIVGAERNEVPAFLSLSNVAVFFIKPVFSKKASSPTKLAELLGMGIPVICNSGVGDMEKIFSENNIGKIISNFTDEEFNPVIAYFFDEGEKISKIKLREIAVINFSLEEGVKRYEKVYNKLIDK